MTTTTTRLRTARCRGGGDKAPVVVLACPRAAKGRAERW